MAKIGERVGAILSATEKEVKFLGWGIYEGDFVPPKNIGLSGAAGIENPRIKLDNGKIVWGCECWWGGVEHVKRHLEGKKIIEVDIEKERRD